MTRRILLSAPDVGELEESYVVDAIRSGWVAPVGPDIEAFEREVAERVGVPYAVALSSGTAALHLGLLALGVGPGDAVLVPTLTFAASANAVVYTGAEPVFVDSEPVSGNVCPELVASALGDLCGSGRRIGAVISVDLFGRCADYAALLPLCAEYGVPLLEDSAEAFGSAYRGRAAGSFGAAGVLSFNGNKIMTTSGGGMLLSADCELVERSRYLSTQARQPVAHYEHADIGYNYRLSNVLAALGRAQLLRLDGMISRRRELRESYTKIFSGVDGVRILGGPDDSTVDNCWLSVLTIDPAKAGWTAGDLGAHLAARDIETRPVWKPMHRQPVFAGCRTVLNGTADRLFGTGLTLPSGSALDDEQRQRVFDAIDGFLR